MNWSLIGWLMKQELKINRIATIGSIISTVFAAILATISIKSLWSHETSSISFFLMDYMMLIFTPFLATMFMSRVYLTFQSIKEDPLSKQMALYRTLPMSVQVIATTKTLSMLIRLIVQSLVFYTVLGVLTFFYIDTTQLSITEFFLFALFWFGYALILGGAYPVMEFGLNAKKIFIISFITMFIFVLVEIYLYIWQEANAVIWVFQLISDYGWHPIAVMIGLGIIATCLWNYLLVYLLQNRDYV